VRAGATSPVEASRAAVAAEQVGIERERTSRALEASRAALAAAWGARVATFERVIGDLDSVAPPPDYASLSRALADDPDVARWATEVAAREAALASERAQRVPDLTFELGPRFYGEGSRAAMVAGFSVPLPLWDRRRGGVLQAEYRLKRAAAERAAAEVAAEAQLRSAYEALAAAQAEVVALRERALPAAQSAYSGALEGYRTGRFRYLEVLDAQRTLFELRGSQIDALAAYHTAAADLERLTGTPLDRLSGRP
jgi:cobalt-zinc-cadmium efflux system outer membrane protein